jgi:hypothetical protein
MIDTCAYRVVTYSELGVTEWQPTVGLQIGRFAVRQLQPGELLCDGRDTFRVVARFIVDHVPSGHGLIGTMRFEDAVMIADDVSRFAVADPDAGHIEQALEQIGPELLDWLRSCSKRGEFGPFRQWQAKRAVSA